MLSEVFTYNANIRSLLSEFNDFKHIRSHFKANNITFYIIALQEVWKNMP